jgi:APA family basic amino acid/polyamine antiporter
MNEAASNRDSAKLAGHGFQQRLGLFDATMLVAGSMIGSGIFIVSADIARDVGSAGWLLAVWVLTGVITIFGALSYAELAAMMPHAGGQYVYLREAYGPVWGFLYGWTLFLVIQTGTIAAVAVAFAKFTGVFFPELGADPKAGAYVLFEQMILVPNFKFTADWTPFTPYLFQITAGQALGVALIVLLTGINLLGVQEGKWVQNVFTVAKIFGLALLIVLGLTVAVDRKVIELNAAELWGGIRETPAFADVLGWMPLSGLAVLMVVGGAMVGSLFSADAWNNVTFTAGEVKNPRRNLPLSLVLGTGTVIGLYILANVAYVVGLPVHGNPELDGQLQALNRREEQLVSLKQTAAAKKVHEEKEQLLAQASTRDRGIAYAKDDRVGTAVMEVVSPGLGTPLMAIAIMLSTFGCTNGLILSGARLYYAMARDGLFFQSVGRLNAKGVPAAGLILQGVWAILLTFSGKYSDLLDYVIFAALLFYVLTVIGLFVLRSTRPDAERPYRAIAYPIMPAVYVFLCAAIMFDLLIVKPWYTWPGLGIVLTGFPVYFLWRAFGRAPALPEGAALQPVDERAQTPEEHIQKPLPS